jgi:hypothetical protein
MRTAHTDGSASSAAFFEGTYRGSPDSGLTGELRKLLKKAPPEEDVPTGPDFDSLRVMRLIHLTKVTQ